MNTLFENPRMSITRLAIADVMTVSYEQGGFEGWAPDSDDSEFG